MTTTERNTVIACDPYRALIAELLTAARAVVSARLDGGISQADLWRYAYECAAAAVTKTDADRSILTIELEAWCKKEDLPFSCDPNEILVRDGINRRQRFWLLDLVGRWNKATHKVQSTAHHKKAICPECSSVNVTADAAARWDIETQAWEVSNVFDKGRSCDDCQASNISFKWVRTDESEDRPSDIADP